MLGYINSKLPDFELSSTNVAGLAAVTAGATVAFCVVSRALSYFAKQSRENQKLKDHINQQERVVAEINSRIASLETQNTTKTEEIRILKAGIQSLTDRVGRLESRVKILEERPSQDFESLKSRVQEDSNRIAALEGKRTSEKIMGSPSFRESAGLPPNKFITTFSPKDINTLERTPRIPSRTYQMLGTISPTNNLGSPNSHTLPNSLPPTTPPNPSIPTAVNLLQQTNGLPTSLHGWQNKFQFRFRRFT